MSDLGYPSIRLLVQVMYEHWNKNYDTHASRPQMRDRTDTFTSQDSPWSLGNRTQTQVKKGQQENTETIRCMNDTPFLREEASPDYNTISSTTSKC